MAGVKDAKASVPCFPSPATAVRSMKLERNVAGRVRRTARAGPPQAKRRMRSAMGRVTCHWYREGMRNKAQRHNGIINGTYIHTYTKESCMV